MGVKQPTNKSHLCLSFCLLESFTYPSFHNFSRHTYTFLPRPVLSVCTGLSPMLHFGKSPLFATPLFLFSILETQHVGRVPRPVLLVDGILLVEVTGGLRPLSANTTLWRGRQLDGRSEWPGLISRLVAPLWCPKNI